MDTLNDAIHVIPNPATEYLSDTEISENNDYVEKLKTINNNRRKRKFYTFDDWCLVYSDDLWHLWGIISEFKKGSYILEYLDYPRFCSMCYQNSSGK